MNSRSKQQVFGSGALSPTAAGLRAGRVVPGLVATQAKFGVLTISGGKRGLEHTCVAGVPRERLKDVVVQGGSQR